MPIGSPMVLAGGYTWTKDNIGFSSKADRIAGAARKLVVGLAIRQTVTIVAGDGPLADGHRLALLRSPCAIPPPPFSEIPAHPRSPPWGTGRRHTWSF